MRWQEKGQDVDRSCRNLRLSDNMVSLEAVPSEPYRTDPVVYRNPADRSPSGSAAAGPNPAFPYDRRPADLVVTCIATTTYDCARPLAMA